MEDGREIVWTDLALEELENTVQYLEEKFSQKEINRLGDEIERILLIISKNPDIFPLSDRLNARKAVLLKFNSMYYRATKNQIQILSFYSNRQSPEKLNK